MMRILFVALLALSGHLVSGVTVDKLEAAGSAVDAFECDSSGSGSCQVAAQGQIEEVLDTDEFGRVGMKLLQKKSRKRKSRGKRTKSKKKARKSRGKKGGSKKKPAPKKTTTPKKKTAPKKKPAPKKKTAPKKKPAPKKKTAPKAVATKTAAVKAAPAPPPPPPAGGLKGYFQHNGGGCPNVGGPGWATQVGAPPGNGAFNVKPEMKAYYAGPGKHINTAGGKIKMSYKKVGNGATFCNPAAGKKVLVGGAVIFKKGGKCTLPPTKNNGGHCCTMKIWQPNNQGFYEDACSVSVNIGGDGTWWLYTELPGDETKGGYKDPEAHLHYHITCGGCQKGAFKTLKTSRGNGYWNKWWLKGVCKAPACGKTGAQHKSIATKSTGGVPTYKYHTVIEYK